MSSPQPSSATGTALKSTASSNAPNEGGLYLFDFDGVVCDSCDECTVSALRTIRRLGALDQPMDTVPDYPPQWLFDKMREIRPAIEVGWQIPVLLSVFSGRFGSQPEAFACLLDQAERRGMSIDLGEADVIQHGADVRLAHYFRPQVVARIQAAQGES